MSQDTFQRRTCLCSRCPGSASYTVGVCACGARGNWLSGPAAPVISASDHVSTGVKTDYVIVCCGA